MPRRRNRLLALAFGLILLSLCLSATGAPLRYGLWSLLSISPFLASGLIIVYAARIRVSILYLFALAPAPLWLLGFMAALFGSHSFSPVAALLVSAVVLGSAWTLSEPRSGLRFGRA